MLSPPRHPANEDSNNLHFSQQRRKMRPNTSSGGGGALPFSDQAMAAKLGFGFGIYSAAPSASYAGVKGTTPPPDWLRRSRTLTASLGGLFRGEMAADFACKDSQHECAFVVRSLRKKRLGTFGKAPPKGRARKGAFREAPAANACA